MKKLLFAACSLLCIAGPAGAATVVLDDLAADGYGNTVYSYHAWLGENEGLRPGSRFVIFDFAGYVPGSIFSPSPDLRASVELVSDTPDGRGQFDDPGLVNLVFTYVGPSFRPLGGNYGFDGFGAASIFSRTRLAGLGASTVLANSTGNGRLDMQGEILVAAAIPEPAAWAMLIAGFALAGAAIRVRAGHRTRLIG